MPVILYDGQDLADITVQEYGFLSALFNLVKANGLALTADLTAGQVLVLPAVDPEPTAVNTPVEPVIIPPVIVEDGQNILDLVLQEYGGLEELFRFVNHNALATTQDLVVGLPVKTETTKNKIALFFKVNGIKINTGATMAATLDGDFSDDFNADFSS